MNLVERVIVGSRAREEGVGLAGGEYVMTPSSTVGLSPHCCKGADKASFGRLEPTIDYFWRAVRRKRKGEERVKFPQSPLFQVVVESLTSSKLTRSTTPTLVSFILSENPSLSPCIVFASPLFFFARWRRRRHRVLCASFLIEMDGDRIGVPFLCQEKVEALFFSRSALLSKDLFISCISSSSPQHTREFTY